MPLMREVGPLFCDLYHLTMGQVLFDENKHEDPAVFEMYIRKAPFNGQYLLTSGQQLALEWLKDWRLDKKRINWLSSLTTKDIKPYLTEDFMSSLDERRRQRFELYAGSDEPRPLFSKDYLEYLSKMTMEGLDIDFVSEGTIVFPNEPIYSVRGPMFKALFIESALLNITNSSSLFATLASHLVHIANGRPVIDFGLRRAQDLGCFVPTRSAYIGGTLGSSNVEACFQLDIKPIGTMAHALVMVYEDELDAFAAWAKSYPDMTLFLVDTYDTIEGVKKAINTCKKLNIPLEGIRLDSGNFIELSKAARELMDKAGYSKAKITASNDLDYSSINSLQQDGALIDVYATGTRLVTAYEQPALGGVYKLKSISGSARIKLSGDPVKVTVPESLNAFRFYDRDGFCDGDVIFSQDYSVPMGAITALDHRSVDPTPVHYEANRTREEMLKPAVRNGEVIANLLPIRELREFAKNNLERLPKKYRGMDCSDVYPLGLEEGLCKRREQMIRAQIAKRDFCLTA